MRLPILPLSLALVAAGCARGPASGAPAGTLHPATPSSAARTPPPAPSSAAPPPSSPLDVASALCRERSPCHVAGRHDAGRDEAGLALLVIELALDDNEGGAARYGEACARRQWWSLALRGGAIARRQLVADLCNDGYGAAMVGEDDVAVSPNQLRHAQSGGSNWRWTTTREVRLSPPTIVEVVTEGSFALGSNRSTVRFDWTTFTGTEHWFAPDCGHEDDAPPDADPYESVVIPDAAVPADFAAGGWKRTSLGACAATVDATGARGFVVHGRTGTATDTSMKVATAGDRLYVEVQDDHLVTAAPKPLANDHLEIWLAPVAPSYFEHCLEHTDKPVQWLVAVADGAVTAGAARSRGVAPRAERVVAGDTVRFAVDLPTGMEALTVVYSDGDDGRTQGRLVATSRLRHGVKATLGHRARLPTTCVAHGGALQPAPRPAPDPDAPLLEHGP